MEYFIAIPSRRRLDTITKKTLPMLDDMGVRRDRIDIFVSDAEDQRAYSARLAPGYRLHTAEPGVGAARNFIRRFYAPGTLVLCIDDDVPAVKIRTSEKTLTVLDTLDDITTTGFRHMEQCGATIWGVYPVMNPMFMRTTITFDLRYIAGAFYGMKVDHDPRRMCTLDDKEDYERSITHYLLDGAVVRLNYVALATTGYQGAGGMQIDRTAARITRSALILAHRFPKLCTINTSKKSKKTELRLRDRRSHRVLKNKTL